MYERSLNTVYVVTITNSKTGKIDTSFLTGPFHTLEEAKEAVRLIYRRVEREKDVYDTYKVEWILLVDLETTTKDWSL